MKFHLFIGRWQSPHLGHLWLLNQKLASNENVLIAIRDVPSDEANPFSAVEVKSMLTSAFKEQIEKGRVRVIIIPDIASVNYGRGVGYEIIEHKPPKDIKAISATEIRRQIRSGESGWKSMVIPGTENFLQEKFGDN